MSEYNGETSRLVGSNSGSASISYLNVIGNVCSVLFLGIVTYCCFAEGATLFSFHPILMSLGWMILMTSGVNAVTPGDLATEWMPLRLRSARHWVIQVITGVIILSGFLVIIINKYINDKAHFVTLHAKFGLASFVFMLTTMLGGLCALYSLSLKSYLAPIYTKTLHAFLGLTTFCLGVITIILGCFSNWWSYGETLRYISIALVLCVMLFTMLRPSLKIYFRMSEKFSNTN